MFENFFDCTQTRRLKKEIKAHDRLISVLLKVDSLLNKTNTTAVWSASFDCKIKLWATEEHNDYQCLKVLTQTGANPQPITSLAFIDGVIWSGSLRYIQIWR